MNIILIHTHDTGRYISPYGYSAKTNNLQILSNKGYTYRNAFTVAPTCSPSRSALMTGLYPHQNGMYGLAHRGSRINDYELHLSNFLKSKNYETALFGIQHEIDYKNIMSNINNKSLLFNIVDDPVQLNPIMNKKKILEMKSKILHKIESLEAPKEMLDRFKFQ